MVKLSDAKGRLRSTRAVTDDQGAFVLLADPSTAVVRLRFGPKDPDHSLPYGMLASPIDLFKVKKKGGKGHELGVISVGQLGPMVTVQPKVVGHDGQSVNSLFLALSPRRERESQGDGTVTPILSPPPARDGGGSQKAMALRLLLAFV